MFPNLNSGKVRKFQGFGNLCVRRRLPYRIEKLLGSKKLAEMAPAAKSLGRPQSAKAVCQEVLKRFDAKAEG
jgi:hypothetical protein